MQVLVFEPKFVGHFLGFAAITANVFDQLGCRTVLALPRSALETEEAKVKLASLSENVEVRFTIDVPKLYKKWTNARFETDALATILGEQTVDHLVIPSGDFVLSGLLYNRGLRRKLSELGGTFEGVDLILHNCAQVYPKLGLKKRCACYCDQLAVSMARSIRLHTVDPYATSSASVSRMSLFGNPVHALPHFHDVPKNPPGQSAARAALNLPATGRLLGSIGDLGARKGTELLIESFAVSQPNVGVHLVLFGLLSRSARQMLNRNRRLVENGQIIYRDQFVTDAEFRNFLFAMDAIWAGFPWHVGISSTILHAASARRPVISSDYGCVAWLTSEFGLGCICPASVAAMSEAIRRFQQVEAWRPDAQGLDRLLSYHTTENFAKHLTHGIRQRMTGLATNSVGNRLEEVVS